MYVYGGKSNGYHDDLYQYNFGKGEWEHIKSKNNPVARYGHSAVIFEGEMYVFGGYDHHGFACDDVYKFSFKACRWKLLKTVKDKDVKNTRFHHTAVIHERSMFVFGGKGFQNECDSDLLELHIDTKRWSTVNTAGKVPSSRWGHSAVVISGDMYIFGGCSGTTNSAELYKYTFASRTWTIIELPSCPTPRYFHGCTVSNRSIYIFGGKNIHDSCFKDLHAYNCEGRGCDAGNSATNSSSIAHAPRDRQPEAAPSNTSNSVPSKNTSTVTTGQRSGSQEIKLKCVYGEEMRVRKVARDIKYSKLMQIFQQEYKASIRMEYEDEEGDLITVRSQEDLTEAFSHFVLHHGSARTYKVYLKPQSVPNSPITSLENQPVTPAEVAGRITEMIEQSKKSRSKKKKRKKSRSKLHRSDDAAIRKKEINSSATTTPIKWKNSGLIIGKGGFGTVYKGMTDLGELIAVKQIDIPQESEAVHALSQLSREITIMQSLSHINIVRYLGCEKTDTTFNIFLEYVPGGSIASLLRSFKKFSENTVRNYTQQILTGLNYLHKKGFAHRDIKGANILVDNVGTVKLADFGASKKLKNYISYGKGCDTMTGTPFWMAPEVVTAKPYGRKADVWSLGAVVVEMVTGIPPWGDLDPVAAVFKIGSENAQPAIPEELSESGKDFLGLCFSRSPKLRPKASTLLLHAFVANSENFASMGGDKNGTIYTFVSEDSSQKPTHPDERTDATATDSTPPLHKDQRLSVDGEEQEDGSDDEYSDQGDSEDLFDIDHFGETSSSNSFGDFSLRNGTESS
eukprot:TRINITY_DN8591_c0_g1_i1.p1 TRINITY_DN8591_c0_g1~~TRINITY_DN8591_c0_g1_i1.p1  ORF type:complete len:794 (-),score=120.77 TRINITY_DN8591_c0_g1_i1:26-2407(-)